jgi:site-specific recombinase XerD
LEICLLDAFFDPLYVAAFNKNTSSKTTKLVKKIISKNSLENLTVHDFRRWLGSRLEDHINSSNARAISSLRSFFKFSNQNLLIKNNKNAKNCQANSKGS